MRVASAGGEQAMGDGMKRKMALKPGTGMLAQVGLRDELLGYLRPEERLLVAPVRWVTPPWSLSFPQRGTDTQHEFLGRRIGHRAAHLDVQLEW